MTINGATNFLYDTEAVITISSGFRSIYGLKLLS